ncbi:MAG TPA: SUMF1/EgtB/PvdO family nonheme iron enzyme [Kofleriaceae bacterium]
MFALLSLLAGTACGRLWFDPIDTASDSVLVDGPNPLSCEGLAPTCGPTSTSPCCDSPVVPGGTFYRGYDVGTDNMYPDMSFPATVSSFRLDKYEITVGRFRQFVNAGFGTQQQPPEANAGARTLNGMESAGWDPSWNASLEVDTATLIAALDCDASMHTWTDPPGANENRPLNCITWFEAMAFCAWDGGFLPTEAEWNFAAAGGSVARAYPWSSPPSDIVINRIYASYWDTTDGCVGDGDPACTLTDLLPVGSLPAGDGLWGQSDLGGNVWEWLLDWSAAPLEYAMTTCIDCANLTPSPNRTMRSGCFGIGAENARGAARSVAGPTARLYVTGARCARRE